MGVRVRIGYLCLACLLALGATAQPRKPVAQLPQDDKAEALFVLGDKYFKTRNYTDAANSFWQVGQRPLNRLSSQAAYMTALSFCMAGNDQRALEAFQTFIRRYGRSKYIPDANYHKATIMLRDPAKQEGGLYVLLNLIERTTDTQLKQDAEALLGKFLYQDAEVAMLERYLHKVRIGFKQQVFEALAYRLHQTGRQQALERLVETRDRELELSPNLQKLLVRTDSSRKRSSLLRVAIVLPFHAADADSAVPAQAKPALELLEGMRLAAEQDSVPYLKRIEWRLWDSASDSARTAALMTREVLPYQPHVVIGDIYNRSSRAIAEAVAGRNILHLVPLSNSAELTTHGPGTLLMNPSADTTALRMARYARTKLGHKKFLFLLDHTRSSDQLAASFTKGLGKDFSREGVSIKRIRIVGSHQQATEQITELVKPLRDEPYDAVYVPINNEELVSYVLFALSRDSVATQVIGTDSWGGFVKLDREVLFRHKTIMADPYYEGLDTMAAVRFRNRYISQYHGIPSAYSMQGYDLMRMLLRGLAGYATPDTVAGYLRRMPSFKGMNQYVRFTRGQANGRVQVLIYSEGEVRREQLD